MSRQPSVSQSGSSFPTPPSARLSRIDSGDVPYDLPQSHQQSSSLHAHSSLERAPHHGSSLATEPAADVSETSPLARTPAQALDAEAHQWASPTTRAAADCSNSTGSMAQPTGSTPIGYRGPGIAAPEVRPRISPFQASRQLQAASLSNFPMTRGADGTAQTPSAPLEHPAALPGVPQGTAQVHSNTFSQGTGDAAGTMQAWSRAAPGPTAFQWQFAGVQPPAQPLWLPQHPAAQVSLVAALLQWGQMQKRLCAYVAKLPSNHTSRRG